MIAESEILFEQLLSAKSDEEEFALLLSRLPEAEREAVWIAAVPHWFDGAVLSALMLVSHDEGEGLYRALQSLAFVSPYQGKGSNIHELTRNILLRLWWSRRQEQFITISRRAEVYFGEQADENSLVESAYHSLTSGVHDAQALTTKWASVAAHLRSSGQFILIHPLIQGLREQIAGGRLVEQNINAMRGWEQRLADDLVVWAEQIKTDVESIDAAELLSEAGAIYADLGDRPREAGVLLQLGRTYRKRKDWEKAKRDLEQGLERLIHLGDLANAADTCAELGGIFIAKGEINYALKYFERGLAIFEASKNCRLGRIDVLRMEGRYADALVEIVHVLEANPKDSRAFANRGDIARLQGAYREAIDDLNNAISLKPDFRWAYVSRGQTFRQQGRFDEAIADFTRAVELNPNYGWAIEQRGDAYRQQGRFDDAIADFTRAIELNPSDEWANSHRGQAYRQQGRFDDAIADFTRAIELDPSDSWAIASRGQAFQQQRRFDEAMTDFTQAIELDPSAGWIFRERGELHRQQGRFDDAIADFTRAVELNPSDSTALRGRAEVYQQLGRLEESNRDVELANTLIAEVPNLSAEK